MSRRDIEDAKPAAALALAVLAAVNGPACASTYFVATNGSDSNNGAIATPFATFGKAIATAASGDTIYARGGTYNLSSTVSIGASKNGSAASPFNLLAYNNEVPVLDFHSQALGSRGVSLDASYWNISGLTVQYAGDNGIFVSGSNNVIQRCVARQNQDSGVQISSSGSRTPSNNLILNVDSYGNYDSQNNQLGENADGFAVKFRGLGPGNVLSGCRAWNNSDDGYDFWQAQNGVVVQNCQSFHNGIASSFSGVPGTFAGDGNGIKLGHDSGTHLLKNMLIWGNPANGIDVNGNATQLESDPPTITHGVTILNNTAVNNGGKNFQFDENPTTATPPTNHILRNNISYLGGGQTIAAGNTSDHNTWSGGGLAAAAGDFTSTTDPVTADGLYHPLTDRSGTTTPSYGSGLAMGPRQADGSLPDLGGFMRFKSTSHLINAGVNVGLPYIGPAPDLGAFEFVPAGQAYWGAPAGGFAELSWNWIAGVAPTAATSTNFDLDAASNYTVAFSTSATHAAATINSGAVTFNLNANAYTVTGNVTVASGARLTIRNGTPKLGGVSALGTGKLDLTNNKLILTDAPIGSWNGSAYDGVSGLIASGYHFGAWDGPGIMTSMPDASAGLTTLAVATGQQVRGLGASDTDTWAGQTISGASTLVMYTWAGDANLDGVIDGGDYGIIDNNVQLPGASGYFNGDFNYDGTIDGGDYGIIDNNIQAQGAPFPTSGSVGSVESAGPAGVSAVPEPSGCGLGILAGIGLFRRRGRRRLGEIASPVTAAIVRP